MSPEDLKRLLELRERGDDGLEDREYQEYLDLRDRRQDELKALTPTPACCKAAQRFPAIWFRVDFDDDTPSDTAPGRWVLSTNWELRPSDTRGRPPEPVACPYCGEFLPTMRRKDPPPPGVCVVKDGGNYCVTCRERLDACLCDPPESAWEPAP